MKAIEIEEKKRGRMKESESNKKRNKRKGKDLSFTCSFDWSFSRRAHVSAHRRNGPHVDAERKKKKKENS